jgi:hypothetical protein
MPAAAEVSRNYIFEKYLLPLITLTSQKFLIFSKSWMLSVTTKTPARFAVRAISTSLMMRYRSVADIVGMRPVFLDLRPRCKALSTTPACHQSSSFGTSSLLAFRYSCLKRSNSLTVDPSVAPATSSCRLRQTSRNREERL